MHVTWEIVASLFAGKQDRVGWDTAPCPSRVIAAARHHQEDPSRDLGAADDVGALSLRVLIALRIVKVF